MPGYLGVAVCVLLIEAFWLRIAPGEQVQAAAPTLACSKGLIVYLYAPDSREAKSFRTRNGVELRASGPLLTISGPMVESAVISTYYQYNSAEERARATPSETFFSVSLRLNHTGTEQVEKILAGKQSPQFVAVCNDAALIAWPMRRERVEAIDLLINDTAEAAEAFARSFTANVSWGQHMPAPE